MLPLSSEVRVSAKGPEREGELDFPTLGRHLSDSSEQRSSRASVPIVAAGQEEREKNSDGGASE